MSIIRVCQFLLIPLTCFIINGQEIKMTGVVLALENEEPIPFVNIGILHKNQGTITNEKGEFNWKIPIEFEGDSITISHLNYYPTKLLATNFEEKKVFLKPRTFELDEIIVNNRKIKTQKRGVKSYSRLLSMRVVSKSNDIVEAAQRINIPEKEVKVKAVNIAVRKWSKLNGVRIRINFYENANNYPGKRIVFRNIVKEIQYKDGSDWIHFDIGQEDIYLSTDFFIGIEFIPNFKNPSLIDLGGIISKGKGYSRETSLGSWNKLNGAVSINVEIEY